MKEFIYEGARQIREKIGFPPKKPEQKYKP